MKKLVIVFFIALTVILPSTLLVAEPRTSAVDVLKTCNIKVTAGETRPTICRDASAQNRSGSNPVINILKTVLNILSIVAGIASILLLIVNGLRLVVSNGDANGVKTARSGIVYVLVGVLIVLVAQSLVVFVLEKI